MILHYGCNCSPNGPVAWSHRDGDRCWMCHQRSTTPAWKVWREHGVLFPNDISMGFGAPTPS